VLHHRGTKGETRSVDAGQYVLFDPAELEKLRSAKDKTIGIAAFIPPDAVDPVYHAGGTYYLVPDGAVAQKPYALLHKVMVKEGQVAFAQVVLREREQIVLLRPMGKVIAMTFLNYSEAVKNPAEFEK
jgi:DNA end-binding protein Ku